MRQVLTLAVFATLWPAQAQDRAVVPSPAHLKGFSEDAFHENGSIMGLRITGNVDVAVAGTYRLTLELKAENGKSMWGYAQAPLEVGSQALTASFDAKGIKEYLAQDGPYRIADAKLFLDIQGRGVLADNLAEGGMTGLYHLNELYPNSFYFTNEVEAEGVDPTPEGKFTKLRVRFGVVTPGGSCGWWGNLADQARRDFGVKNGGGNSLPPGRSMLALDFDGFDVAQRSADGPLVLSSLSVHCGGTLGIQPSISDGARHRTASFRSADFDNPDPDWKFLLSDKPVRIAAGDGAGLLVWVRPIGLHDVVLDAIAQLDDPGIRFAMNDGKTCSSGPSCWTGQYVGGLLVVRTSPDVKPGSHIIRLSARGAGKEHSIDVPIFVDPDLTNRKVQMERRRAEALAHLLQEDATPPIPPVTPPSSVDSELHPAVTFSAGVTLRKVRAVLILDRSGSMAGPTCDFVRGSANRFSRLFADRRDSLAVISYAESVQLVLPLTDHFLPDAPDGISKMVCLGWTNAAEALEVAEHELAGFDDPDAINVLILFTDGGSGSLSANWPFRNPAKEWCGGRTGSCPLPADCLEFLPEGHVPAVLSPVYSLDNTRIEQVTFSIHPALGESATGRRISNPKLNRCGLVAAGSSLPFAFMPDQDFWGTSFTASRPLERHVDGPYAGKIRLDLPQNVANAAANQMDNIASRLRTGPPNPPIVYVVGFATGRSGTEMESLDYFRKLSNDPAGTSFDPARPAGLTIVTDKPEDFWPAFQRVRQEIVRHATVK